MTTLDGPVGRRNGVAVLSAPDDQRKIIDLLDRIGPSDGGQSGAWSKPSPGRRYAPPSALVAAIKQFQQRWQPTGEIPKVDSVVDPNGKTLGKLDALAGAPSGPLPVGPGGTNPELIHGMLVEQMNPDAAVPVVEKKMVLAPFIPGMPAMQVPVVGVFYPFRFRIEKDGRNYWVGVAASPLTSDFTQAQIFIHPTPTQGKVVVATVGDYPRFAGGWNKIWRYLPTIGTQMAAVRPTLLIVPFMPDPARDPESAWNMFSTRPVETLSAIVTATHREMAARLPITGPRQPHKLQRIGVASYSSGIYFQQAFLNLFAGTGLVAETFDFDSRWIVRERKKPWVWTTNARATWISQWAPPKPDSHGRSEYPQPPPGSFIHIPDKALLRVGPPTATAHGKIGNLSYHWMMLRSVIQ
ncbi:hypothetical protein ASE61_11305 [Bosea sp. Root670]|uniref:Peptidoglycan binding-like domain-containing protein n=1 Tax=Bosea robiniae TaxID=1036780 RepID=A0ABY0P162_9HYPH|nr:MULTISPECIES: hypothetical protein [Bosea]KRE03089.1 hypothetical protein ASE61_11305 [Bosea sp. Root670]TQI75718.1 hypothetical protein FHT98_3504 [Bosea sp. AK1]SDG70583.1 hypothetical protein SAMN05421844_10529 [Bosea robiniae]